MRYPRREDWTFKSEATSAGMRKRENPPIQREKDPVVHHREGGERWGCRSHRLLGGWRKRREGFGNFYGGKSPTDWRERGEG